MKKVIGLTGGIASGKTTVCKFIEKNGYQVIDSDKVSRELSEKGMPCFNAIISTFGEEYLSFDGEIDRKKLGELIFGDFKSKELLNSITHPIIIDELVRRINNVEEGIIFIEIPLLYECKLEYLCDKIICVYLAKDIQVKRLMARDGIDEAYANLKIDSQMDLNIKKSLADFVVDTSKEYIEIEQQILEIIKKIKGENVWQQ